MENFKNRGIMLDQSRLLEKRDYYYDLLPWLKKWGYNVLHLHLCDDQGSALRFPSHPELSKSNAFSADEMKSFIEECQKHGLEVIPEIESLGHTGFITANEKYKHLGGGESAYGVFNSIDPENELTKELIADLLRDTAEIFPSKIIHVGLDEVNFSVIPKYKDIEKDEQWKIFAPYAAWVHDCVRSLGKRPAMWGDHIVSTPEMADQFQKDVLIFDWHYDAWVDPKSMEMLLDKGFEVWGGPASACWYAKIIPGRRNIENLRNFSAQAMEFKNRGVTGMMNTVWCPYRYLSGGIDYPIALAGHLFSSETESPDFGANFAADFYGLNEKDAQICFESIADLHNNAPYRSQQLRLLSGKSEGAVFSREDVRLYGIMATKAEACAKTLSSLVPKATRNADRLNDLVLSARAIVASGKYGASNRNPSALPDMATLLNDCIKSWDRTKDEPWDTVYGIDNKTEYLMKFLNHLKSL